AFDEEHIDSLRRLAELAEAAATEWAAEDADVRGGELPTQPVATATLSVAPSSENSLEGERGRRYRGGGIALVVLFLLSVVGWRVRNSASGMVGGQQLAPARITQPIANTEAASVVSGPAPVWKPPSPAHLSNPGNKALALRIAQPVADTEVTHSAPRYRNAPAGHDHAFMPAALATADVPAVPKIASSAASNDDLGRLLSAPATLPASVPVSRGISGGNLVRKVQPLYPPQALLLRLAGSVVLQATIAENGTVRDLKVMSGRPVLARAAVEAVSHWRYRPLMLNGKPIQKREEISINFTLPH
ncbi:MAG: energy transducer TonB, partial [Terriglobales bacterium]